LDNQSKNAISNAQRKPASKNKPQTTTIFAEETYKTPQAALTNIESINKGGYSFSEQLVKHATVTITVYFITPMIVTP